MGPRYREAFLEGHNIYIVMDFAKNGDLHSRIKKLKARNRYFDEEHIWLAIIQILKGLKALHSRDILHRVRPRRWQPAARARRLTQGRTGRT